MKFRALAYPSTRRTTNHCGRSRAAAGSGPPVGERSPLTGSVAPVVHRPGAPDSSGTGTRLGAGRGSSQAATLAARANGAWMRNRVALAEQEPASQRLQVPGQCLEGPVEEGAPFGAAGAAVQQGPVDHEHRHHLVGGGQGGQQGRVVGRPEISAEPDDGTAGHDGDAPRGRPGAGCSRLSTAHHPPLRVAVGLRLRIGAGPSAVGW
jgi:hypothetical protein